MSGKSEAARGVHGPVCPHPSILRLYKLKESRLYLHSSSKQSPSPFTAPRVSWRLHHLHCQRRSKRPACQYQTTGAILFDLEHCT